jgi:Domain of Unknown Function (DUF1206)
MKPTDDVAPWIERLARLGYTAKGILYMTIGYLAAKAALGRGGRVTDTRGAFQSVNSAQSGRAALVLIGAGLIGYAVWRLVEAGIDPERRGSDYKAIAVRLGYAARGVFHAGLGITALRVAFGDGGGSGSNQASHWTARAFELRGGELLVWLGGLWIGGYGVYQFYRAWSPNMRRHLRLAELPTGVRDGVLGVSRFGIAARGVVFCLIGYFLIRAALQHDSAEAGGVRESLRTVAHTGQWPFAVIALGLVAYGVYELVNARYRSIRVV